MRGGDVEGLGGASRPPQSLPLKGLGCIAAHSVPCVGMGTGTAWNWEVWWDWVGWKVPRVVRPYTSFVPVCLQSTPTTSGWTRSWAPWPSASSGRSWRTTRSTAPSTSTGSSSGPARCVGALFAPLGALKPVPKRAGSGERLWVRPHPVIVVPPIPILGLSPSCSPPSSSPSWLLPHPIITTIVPVVPIPDPSLSHHHRPHLGSVSILFAIVPISGPSSSSSFPSWVCPRCS